MPVAVRDDHQDVATTISNEMLLPQGAAHGSSADASVVSTVAVAAEKERILVTTVEMRPYRKRSGAPTFTQHTVFAVNSQNCPSVNRGVAK
jgi:hypothetical protein